MAWEWRADGGSAEVELLVTRERWHCEQLCTVNGKLIDLSRAEVDFERHVSSREAD